MRFFLDFSVAELAVGLGLAAGVGFAVGLALEVFAFMEVDFTDNDPAIFQKIKKTLTM